MSRTQFFLRIALLVIVTGLVGCAETKRIMRYGIEDMPSESRPHWPSLPEIPRYSYGGQLLGWENFPIVQKDKQEAGEQVLYWLAGLDPKTGLGYRDPSRGLQRPQSGIVDLMGRIYVTDSGQNAVVVFDPSTAKLYIWNKASQHDDFSAPVGVALGPNQHIFVADAQLKRIFRLNQKGEPVAEFGRGLLQRPTGLARDPKRGILYVADTRSHEIKLFNDSGTYIKKIGGSGTSPGTFNGPTHIAFAHDKLYVADTLNARIQIFDHQGKFLFAFGDRGIRVGNMVRPKGVSVDSEGNIYVIESLHDHLLVYDKKGRFLLPIGGTGKEVGEFYLPSGIWINDKDQIFVSDMFNGRVMLFHFLGGL